MPIGWKYSGIWFMCYLIKFEMGAQNGPLPAQYCSAAVTWSNSQEMFVASLDYDMKGQYSHTMGCLSWTNALKFVVGQVNCEA